MKTRSLPGTLLLIIISAIVYTACQKQYSLDLPTTSSTKSITASVTGKVTDNNHLPVSGAIVKSGTASTTTDVNGYFRFPNINIKDPDLAYVTVEKSGFFLGSRTYITTKGSNGYVAIQLIKKNVAGTFFSGTGGAVTVPDNGGKIDFQPSSIVNASSKSTYAGTVSVAAFYINPAASDFQEMMPGALRGIATDNKQVGLQSFGMLAVELTGGSGEKLQLGTDKTATLTFPIDAGLQSQAPATIPLWSFNEGTGLWQQEGTATKQGNNYVGTVTHFSFWNCDFPQPIFKFQAKYINQDGIPLSHVKIIIKTVDDTITTSGYGFTDSAGVINGMIPSTKTLLMTVYNLCGDPLDIRHIGPFIGEVNVGTFTVKTAANASVRFTGSVINCTGGVVTSGFVDVAIDNNHFFGTVVNGNFSMMVSRCNGNPTTASIQAYDDANLVQGAAKQFAVADTIVNTGALSACGTTINEFFNYKLNGSTVVFLNPPDSLAMYLSQGKYQCYFTRKASQSDGASLVFAPTTTGSTPLSSFYMSSGSNSYSLVTTPATNITITENGAIGGYIAGNFSATVKRDSSATTYPVTASFRLKRNQ